MFLNSSAKRYMWSQGLDESCWGSLGKSLLQSKAIQRYVVSKKVPVLRFWKMQQRWNFGQERNSWLCCSIARKETTDSQTTTLGNQVSYRNILVQTFGICWACKSCQSKKNALRVYYTERGHGLHARESHFFKIWYVYWQASHIIDSQACFIFKDGHSCDKSQLHWDLYL